MAGESGASPAGARLLIAAEEGKLVITLAPPAPVEQPARVERNRRSRKAPRPQRRLPHLRSHSCVAAPLRSDQSPVNPSRRRIVSLASRRVWD